MTQVDPPPPLSPQPTRQSQVFTGIMMAVGIILLLPGACALFFAASFFIAEGRGGIREIGRGDPIMQMVLVVWGVSILISLFGIWMLRRARD